MSDKLTFDEALKEINELSFTTDNGESWVNSYTSVYALIQELQEVYASTIEMTENQKNAFDKAKRVLNTRDLALNFGQEWTILDEVSGKVFGHGQGEATNEQIEAIMQAWLHPEMVKVVDDERH